MLSTKLIRSLAFEDVQDITTEVDSAGKRTYYNLKIRLKDAQIIMDGFDIGNWISYDAKQLKAYLEAPSADDFKTKTSYEAIFFFIWDSIRFLDFFLLSCP